MLLLWFNFAAIGLGNALAADVTGDARRDGVAKARMVSGRSADIFGEGPCSSLMLEYAARSVLHDLG